MAQNYLHERGMGSRSKHGKRVERRNTRQTIKDEARHARGNARVQLRREVLGR